MINWNKETKQIELDPKEPIVQISTEKIVEGMIVGIDKAIGKDYSTINGEIVRND